MNRYSQETLRRVEQNDETLKELRMGHFGGVNDDGLYFSRDGNDYSRLGAFIGENTHLTTLNVNVSDVASLSLAQEDFFEGIRRNSSIHDLWIYGGDGYEDGQTQRRSIIVGGVIHEILKVYQEENNSDLTYLRIIFCDLQNGGDHVITKTLRSNTNLKKVSLFSNHISNEQLLAIVEALREHNRLEELDLGPNRIGNGGCETLATLLRDPNSNLHTLMLQNNQIDLQGATALANGLSNNTKLRKLSLQNNPSVSLQNNDSGVQDVFSKLLCNTSSISDTYLSNHTLKTLVVYPQSTGDKLDFLLTLNVGTNKSQVAIKKILKCHYHKIFIDMKPFFEWNMEGEHERNLKALPYIVDWFERAAEVEEGEQYNTNQKKLSTIYQFTQAMPLLFVPASHIKGGESNKAV